MIVREPCLPPGWYPGQKAKIEEFLAPFSQSAHSQAAIAPHAGWFYSGLPAAMAVSSLDREAGTVAVIGGHLPAGMPVLAAEEEGARTPFGIMKIDTELRDEFSKSVSARPDRYRDNTVEVLLPMVHYFFPHSQLLWLRFPAEISSFDAGKLLAGAANRLGRRLAVLASTDLTHYGDNYDYSPMGRGKAALDWVKNVNDAAFISAVLEGDPSGALKHAEDHYSSCSAGAVLGAMGFCSASGKFNARLLDYRTSADVADDGIPDSFVGYAAITIGE